MDSLQHLQTEARNPASSRLDELTAVEFVELMVREDSLVAPAVGLCTREIAEAIEIVTDRLSKGGRLIYLGAGTSGRLGVLDASECPPTFQTRPEQIVGLIAGGPGAMFQAVEGAEDNPELGAADLRTLNLTANDVAFGIATSGRTPYVLGAVQYARSIGAFTIGLACNQDAEIKREVDLAILPIVGPEVLSGSTRLKAGTATKLVLNMITTGAMVRLGKTFGNLMVDLKASNSKLKVRANRIVRTITGLDETAVEELLNRCQGEVKTAIVAHFGKLSVDDARARLQANGNRVRLAVSELTPTSAPSQDRIHRLSRPDLVLGIDGGGTTTVAILASADTGEVLGRGTAGASNIQAVGVQTGLHALETCIDRAFHAAGIDRATTAAACLGLAGIDRQEGLDVIHGWASRVALAERVTVANDATLLLAAGTPEGWGLAVIAGTGSIAFVRTPEGQIGRCGGWGHLLGDEGSAYQITLLALRASCRAVDQCGPATSLVERFNRRMGLRQPADLIPAVYRGPWDRTAIAGLCPMVLEAADAGDQVAAAIIEKQALALARTASGAVKNAKLPLADLPIALAGGVLLGSQIYRETFISGLQSAGIQPGPVTCVDDPALGAVVLARKAITTPA